MVISPDPPPGPERRLTPRLQVNGRIQGEVESMNLRVRVCDIGLGGFSIEAIEELKPGLHSVRFSQGSWSISLEAWIRHARPFCLTDGTVRHVIGFEYVDPQSPDTRQMIDALLERLTSVLVYE
jgi:hypothetical protein